MTEGKANDWKLWAMGLHLSVFSAYVVPLAGLIVPIVLWQVKKKDMPELDAHGKEVTNFLISFVIYSIIVAVLSFVLIGLVLFIPLMIISIVFPIVGGIKANDGVLWHYPLTIRFIK